MPEINYLAVLVAAVANMIIGSLWYGPLFGKLWMEGMGGPGQMKSPSMGSLYVQQFIASLIMAFVVAHITWAFGMALTPAMSDVATGLQTGLWLWLGFAVPFKYGESLWTGKKFKYVAVDLGYWLVVLLVMGIILTVWH
jgi:hypothetical protein